MLSAGSPLSEEKLEGVVFNCSCNIRWIQLWQQRGEAGLHNQQLFCNNGFFKIPLQLMNISHCDLPEISVSHSNLTVIEGDRVTITCNGSGVPVPEVDWTVGGLHSINTHQSNQYPPNVHSINLTLVNVSRDDNSFMLTCIAENIVGMTNASIQLSVQFPPVIIKFEEPQKWHDTCMIFTVRANPLPTLRWYYKGEEIKQTEYVRPEMDVYQDNLEGCLMFKDPTHHNNGNYTLEASNYLGVAVKTVYAHFLRPPFDVSPTPTAIPTMTHRPEEDTFGVSIAVGLAGFACVLLVVMFVLINKYGRRSKFGMKAISGNNEPDGLSAMFLVSKWDSYVTVLDGPLGLSEVQSLCVVGEQLADAVVSRRLGYVLGWRDARLSHAFLILRWVWQGSCFPLSSQNPPKRGRSGYP
ncbi:hypothetical protein QQF64_022702 [Cirrhinus molitorella]|uniref:Ig-like domain-containing protein n=1 Tax=Cirrhinus molitorella TaxID=172907 RepID=A0ABR3L334_9TELE